MSIKLKSDLKLDDQNIQTSESNSISPEDKAVWFIWFGLIFVAFAALPFIAMVPNLSGFVSNLCNSIIQ